MGANLALNVESRGFTCAVFNRTTKKTRAFAEANRWRRIVPGYTMRDFIRSLRRPRRVILMV